MSDSHETALITTDAKPARVQQIHPLIDRALASGLDPETLDKMLTVQLKWEAAQAEKAYTSSMVALKSALPSVIHRDKPVDFGNTPYRHASLAQVVSAVTPHLTDFGFSHGSKATNAEHGAIRVTCTITHAEGHSEETSLDVPPDTSGSKNAVQAMMSSVTLVKRHLLLGMLGIATADMTEDHGPAEGAAPTNRIDRQRNIKAVVAMKAAGLSREDAEGHVEKKVSEWTTVELDELRAWYDAHLAKDGES